MILLRVNGKQYTNFKNASVSFSMDTFAREFRFLAVGSGGDPLPFKGGEACQVFIDDNQVVNGFIDIVDIDYDAGSHNIEILGRGRVADLADSTLDKFELIPEISLKASIEEVIKQIFNKKTLDGTDISVNDLIGDLKLFNKAEDQLGASTGDGAFDFIETLARKRQVILNENGIGNIDIIRTGNEKYEQKLQNIISSDSNNILRASVSYDFTGIYKNYIIKTQQNTSAFSFSGSSSNKDVVFQESCLISPGSRDGRRFAFVAEKASSNEQLIERVKWESNIRRARSRLYAVTFVGHQTHFGEEWVTNKLISVNDEFVGIKEDMLVNGVIFNESLEGEITELNLIDKNAYNPNPEEALSDDVGGKFVFS